MIREVFDIPDSNDIVLARAEIFLREKIEELGGELLRKLDAHGFGEYPSFEAVFYVPELTCDEEITQDTQELAHEYAKLYTQLDNLQEEYLATFGEYL